MGSASIASLLPVLGVALLVLGLPLVAALAHSLGSELPVLGFTKLVLGILRVAVLAAEREHVCQHI